LEDHVLSFQAKPLQKKKTSASQFPSHRSQGHATANHYHVRFNSHDDIQFILPTTNAISNKELQRGASGVASMPTNKHFLDSSDDDDFPMNMFGKQSVVKTPVEVTPNGPEGQNSQTYETTVPPNWNLFPSTNIPRPPTPPQATTGTDFYSSSDLIITCNHTIHCICVNCYCTEKATCTCKVCRQLKQASLNHTMQKPGASTVLSVPSDSLLQFRHYGAVPQTFVDSILCAARSTPLIRAHTHSRGALSHAPHDTLHRLLYHFYSSWNPAFAELSLPIAASIRLASSLKLCCLSFCSSRLSCSFMAVRFLRGSVPGICLNA
jgi:hypothetical protein